MDVRSLNLFASIAMVLTCVIGIARNPPAFHRLRMRRVRSADPLVRAATSATEAYPFRCCTMDADGNSSYYRFTIARIRGSYRAYLDSAPRFNRPWEELGLKRDDGRYYLDAGRDASAADCESAARSWANAQATELNRIS